MKTFLVGLALGFGIGFLLLPRSSNEHEELMREKNQELQRHLPLARERELQSTAVRAGDRFIRARKPEYQSRAGAPRAGVHPVAVLNMASEKELTSAGLEPALVSRIVAGRPYASLHDAIDRDVLPLTALPAIEAVGQAMEPGGTQPLA